MYLSTLLLAALSASASIAAPTRGSCDEHRPERRPARKHEYGRWNNGWEHKWNKHSWKYNKDIKPYFDEFIECKATPNQVISNGESVMGEEGAKGYYKLALNTKENEVCYYITLYGVSGEYQSMARTATHLHEGPKGGSGPPRLAFNNPEGNDHIRVSYGCLKGPFVTGIVVNGEDTGSQFQVKEIVERPQDFYCDVHTQEFIDGAIRGQVAH